MTPYSSILAWRIPWTEEPDGLLSVGSQSHTQPSDWQTHTYSTASRTESVLSAGYSISWCLTSVNLLSLNFPLSSTLTLSQIIKIRHRPEKKKKFIYSAFLVPSSLLCFPREAINHMWTSQSRTLKKITERNIQFGKFYWSSRIFEGSLKFTWKVI